MGQSQGAPSGRNHNRNSSRGPRPGLGLDLGFLLGRRPRPGDEKLNPANWLRRTLSLPLPRPTAEVESEAEAEGKAAGSRVEDEAGGEEADHLVVMVNGLYGSSADWKFAAEQFVKRLPGKLFVHRSQSNHSKLTYDGVDIMGERLAEEVRQVIQRRTNLRKISFVAHSLGGLVTRYAIGKLYECSMVEVSSLDTDKLGDGQKTLDVGKIAGLEPMNFITFATPHLGSRWNKQLPFLFGVPIVERLAAETAHFIVGRTGKHLFLTDRDDGRPPLLLRMVEDCDDGKFMSALRSFKRRVTYANITYDHIVGWRTSSIRRQHELPKLKLTAHDEKYPHIINVDKGNSDECYSRNSEDHQQETSIKDSLVDSLEELMIRGLTRVNWERVDVCIHESRLRYNAHHNIQVIDQEMGKYSDGKDGDVSVSYPLVAVCIDKDKNSQNALKYATETLVHRGQTMVLVHVNTKGNSGGVEDAAGYKQPADPQMKDLFLPFRCFCTRKDIQCKDVVLDDHDVAKSIVEFAAHAAIEKLVLGASTRGGFVRFKPDISSSISKTAPDFCTVYVVTKGGKVSSMRQAIRQAPAVSPLRTMIQVPKPEQVSTQKWTPPPPPARGDAAGTPSFQENHIMSPFSRTGLSGGSVRKVFPDFSLPDSSDISFIGGAPGAGGRASTERYPPRLSTGSDSLDQQQHSFEASRTPSRWGDSFGNDSTSHSQTSTSSWSSQPTEDMEAEMKRLRLELKQTMDMYSTACKEALTAKQKAMELQRWKVEEEQRSQDSRFTEELAMALIEQEKAKARAAIEAAEAAQRLADFEAQKRINAEMKALKEAEERVRSMGAREGAVRYRRYTIEEIEVGTDHFNEARKVGEGGYGPVYKGHLDHTPVAIKVLRPDAAQGRSQFQQEVEVLSCIRHPNMVLLLGACPEYGCLVYEYMANDSLDDCLFRRGGGGPVIPWQHRFRIAAEIATGLLFLHQTKPEPLVHRDLKPGNILLDRNYVSKIGDVGLARLVPPSVADSVTQCHMTSAAGTFCYIDPEYQQTGMLGVKSDVYSLGVMLLQIITARPPMGLTHHVARALEHGTMADLLDQSVHDWPVDEAIRFAEVSLRCCELRRKDRPDLATVVLPELNRLRALGEDNMQFCDNLSGRGGSGMHNSSFYSNSSYSQPRHDASSDPMLGRPQYSSNSNQPAMHGRRYNYN